MLSKKKISSVVPGAVLAASLGLAAAAASSLGAGPTTHVVKAQHVRFSPTRLVIGRGDRVTWKFLDGALRIKHTVTSQGSRHFKDMPLERQAGSFTARFSRAGVYHYICTNHEATMSAVIIVR